MRFVYMLLFEKLPYLYNNNGSASFEIDARVTTCQDRLGTIANALHLYPRSSRKGPKTMTPIGCSQLAVLLKNVDS